MELTVPEPAVAHSVFIHADSAPIVLHTHLEELTGLPQSFRKCGRKPKTKL
jgi:hypothetical protein